MSDDWIIYYDAPRRLYDALPDDNVGDVGSNWQPTTREGADAFLAEMAALSGWQRGHENNPRF